MNGGADLKVYELFGSLADEEREIVADLLERLDLDPGEQLFREGQESEGLVLVESGALRLTSSRAGDLGLVGAGEWLGAVGLVVPGRREATAVAEGDVRVWTLTREAFQRLLIDDARAGLRILEIALSDFAHVTRLALDRLAV